MLPPTAEYLFMQQVLTAFSLAKVWPDNNWECNVVRAAINACSVLALVMEVLCGPQPWPSTMATLVATTMGLCMRNTAYLINMIHAGHGQELEWNVKGVKSMKIFDLRPSTSRGSISTKNRQTSGSGGSSDISPSNFSSTTTFTIDYRQSNRAELLRHFS